MECLIAVAHGEDFLQLRSVAIRRSPERWRWFKTWLLRTLCAMDYVQLLLWGGYTKFRPHLVPERAGLNAGASNDSLFLAALIERLAHRMRNLLGAPGSPLTLLEGTSW